jgi:acetolactate decarboxylase
MTGMQCNGNEQGFVLLSGDLKPQEEKNPPVYGSGGRMASHIIAIAVAVIIILVIASGVVVNEAMRPPGPGLTNGTQDTQDEIFQVSTTDALSASLYDGVTTAGEVEKHGDFGSGTFEGIDGELIALDGKFYQARADGTVRTVDPAMEISFATVKFFRQDTSFTETGGKDLADLEQEISRQLPSKNLMYAIKVRGTFPDITVRAIPKQDKPYPPLADAAAQESILHLKSSTGTLIGFYFPSSFSGLNVPGYHFHYISDDHTKGGHVLDLTTPDSSLTVMADQASEIVVSLPATGDFISAGLPKGTTSNITSIETKT